MPARTLKFRYSFFPDVSSSWNSLSTFIKNAPSLDVFKKRLMNFFNVSPNLIFNLHNPNGITYLTRLRVALSHLREHKFSHNFDDTPSSICSCELNQTENIENYLLFCPYYLQIRGEIFDKLCRFS